MRNIRFAALRGVAWLNVVHSMLLVSLAFTVSSCFVANTTIISILVAGLGLICASISIGFSWKAQRHWAFYLFVALQGCLLANSVVHTLLIGRY